MSIALLGLGSNLGEREDFLRRAVTELRSRVGIVLQQSELYYSMPVGFNSCNYFVNQVIAIATVLDPYQLLHATQDIERRMGRTLKSHDGIHYDRTIDIDLLRIFCEARELRLNTSELILPHPRISERPFVLLPMCEILTH